ncbi:MAG: class I SAM-dependent methyltransferase [Deltaproteobacteria bacterium]|nr:class I SAM-dependent methyltransferase [Deltaproteobacteria bacterium]
MKTVHVVSAYVHWGVANVANRFSPKSVLDMGGVGKMSHFLACSVTDANIINNLDATDLPFADNEFDVALSIATLEHVEDWANFLLESLRVSKTAAVHWFPIGSAATEAEHLKKKLGHLHPCCIPSRIEIEDFLMKCDAQWTLAPFMTMGEHLLLLGTINPNINHPDTFAAVQRMGAEPYGVLLTMTKTGDCHDPR